MPAKTVETLNFLFTKSGFAPDGAEALSPDSEARKWAERFVKNSFTALYALGFEEKQAWFSPTCLFLYRVNETFLRTLTRTPGLEELRDNTRLEFSRDDVESLVQNAPFAPGSEFIDPSWMIDVLNGLCRVFAQEIKSYDGSVEFYLTEKKQNLRVPGRIFFHLVENKRDELPFAMMATYADQGEDGQVRHLPLKYALTEFAGDERLLIKLLSNLSRAADRSEFISGLMESGELFYPLKLTSSEAYIFLKEIPVYEESGILCRIPDWGRKDRQRPSVRLVAGDKKPSRVGLDALVCVRPQIEIGGEPVTREELEELLARSEGLALIKGRWVEVDHEKLKAALDTFDRIVRLGETMTLADCMRLELNPDRNAELGLPEDTQVTSGAWLRALRGKMSSPAQTGDAAAPDSFRAVLRPYQQTGFRWIKQLCEMGFGACLADDMGLGKTVEVLALLEDMRVHFGGRVLLVVPASLMGNWQREIGKFAPEMTCKIVHGAYSSDDAEAFVTLTTYGMVAKTESLSRDMWDLVILDEAQAIKNPSAQQTKAVKLLKARAKIIMTGTPVENRAGDLWSLFDFINPGLLGSAKEFASLSKRLTQRGDGFSRIRSIISPFMLRRVKTDKSVISDLPEKTEIKEYIQPSKQQTALYNKAADELIRRIEQTEGIERKGMVLAAIAKFKQLLNHPDQYLGQTEYKEALSGKFVRLRELCETIYEKRERVLVFTQYRELTEPLSDFLTRVFGKRGLVLHGGVTPKKRTEMVETFCGDEYVPYMVLSLKAGGVGLNLTSANHVIHFDRWWNPAVENQATDRAFRIGQKKNVMVYKFISKGTIEEKIDDMIDDKISLARDIVADAGETWITEMSNEKLAELFKLEA